MKKTFVAFTLLAACLAAPLLAQQDDYAKAAIVGRLKNSRDFTVKVAEAMPESDYGFKLTKEQMSFAQQISHLGESFSYFMSTFTGEKAKPGKPASMNKSDVISFVKNAYDQTIDQVSKLSSAQIEKDYKGSDGSSASGLTDLISMLEHAAHHRASAEMYLRAKGIKPPSYMD